MKPPIVSRFGLYGSAVDCITDETVFTSSIVIPMFFGVLCFVLFAILKMAFVLDVRDRWKVTSVKFQSSILHFKFFSVLCAIFS